MKEERIIRGVMASAGIAIGRAIRTFDQHLISYNFHIPQSETSKEVSRFRASIEKSRKQLERMQAELRQSRIPESSFLVDAHLLILQDKLFVDRIIETIQERSVNAEWAIQQVSDELYEAYDRLQDDYLRERRGDLEDIVRRMLHNLRSKAASTLPAMPYDTILVGKTISPSTLFELRASRAAGLVTESGSPLSHTAIVARSLGLPAVMGVHDLSTITSGDVLIVNGTRGMVICNPDRSTLREYRQRTKPARATLRPRDLHIPAVTQDGIRISLGTNINFSEEAKSAVETGTEFIGLYRTEFDFFKEGGKPTEEELMAQYTRVLKTARPAPVNFRTIDVGNDWNSRDGTGSSLSSRGLRFSLENQDVFKLQLRALFRSSKNGRMRILLPFVSTIADLDAALEIIAGVKRDLARHKYDFDKEIPVGVMIETPAAAHTCDLMASRVDFFCLGTNDLIQYYLVIDRSDESAAHLYNPFHPAILRCLHQVYTLLQYSGRPVTVCGEMAADPAAAAVLLGLGFTSLSVSLAAHPKMKEAIGALSVGKLRELTGEIMKMESPKDVEDRVRATIA
ncbi:MAG TPA: phosphoenolpyruvate--protein phosphotransferase [Terriglobia bacterium]|nr:phosphoenolpyruvate--protein phosphotransferase [Terriglobia bacterium]